MTVKEKTTFLTYPLKLKLEYKNVTHMVRKFRRNSDLLSTQVLKQIHALLFEV
jgi:hypothetical protein